MCIIHVLNAQCPCVKTLTNEVTNCAQFSLSNHDWKYFMLLIHVSYVF
jgi:hypothetical protein